MKKIMVWNSDDGLPYADREVAKLLELRSNEWGVVTAGHEIEWDKLASFAAAVEPTIFHFIGHGKANGELLVRQEGSTFGRPAADVIRLVRAASPSLEGVYLSACFSAKTGPELLKLLPTVGGWAIGTTSEVWDDLSAVFAETFYQHLLGDAVSPEKAFEIARSYAEADWPGEVPHTAWFARSSLPNVGTMARDINSKIRGVFDRAAFKTRVRDDASLRELDDALQDVGHALGTGQVLSRQHRTLIQSASFPVEWLQAPEIQNFVNDAMRGLARARKALAVLQAGSQGQDRVFGNVLNFDKTASQEEWMRRVNKVDRARDQILKAANTLFERSDGVYPLPEIGLSFDRKSIELVRQRPSKP